MLWHKPGSPQHESWYYCPDREKAGWRLSLLTPLVFSSRDHIGVTKERSSMSERSGEQGGVREQCSRGSEGRKKGKKTAESWRTGGGGHRGGGGQATAVERTERNIQRGELWSCIQRQLESSGARNGRRIFSPRAARSGGKPDHPTKRFLWRHKTNRDPRWALSDRDRAGWSEIWEVMITTNRIKGASSKMDVWVRDWSVLTCFMPNAFMLSSRRARGDLCATVSRSGQKETAKDQIRLFLKLGF